MPDILVIRGGAIGDFLLTLPALSLVRESMSGCQVSLLGYKPCVELARHFGLADQTRSIEHGPLSSFFIPKAELDPAWMSWFASFSLIVNYLPDEDGIFQENIRRCGVRNFLQGPHKMIETGPHAAIQLAKPLETIALWLEDPWFRFPNHQPVRDSSLVALHPGSGGKHKIWPINRWINLVKRWHQREPGTRFLMITGEAEYERGITSQLRLAWEGLPVEEADFLSLPALSERLQACAAFIGHDSGMSHLAATCGVPSFVLFGPTNPAVWAPPGPDVQILQSPDQTMEGLTQESVENALIQWFNR